MTADYTPTTEMVRAIFAGNGDWEHRGTTYEREEDFDRWLAAHDAEVESRGADRERAAVVAMLRKWSTDEEGWECSGYCDPPKIVDNLATAIEAGEHLGGTDV